MNGFLRVANKFATNLFANIVYIFIIPHKARKTIAIFFATNYFETKEAIYLTQNKSIKLPTNSSAFAPHRASELTPGETERHAHHRFCVPTP